MMLDNAFLVIKILNKQNLLDYPSKINLLSLCNPLKTKLELVPRFFPKLHQYFEDFARTKPDAIAITDVQGKPHSYKEINDQANYWAHYFLDELSIEPGDDVSIGLFLPMSVEYIVMQLALLKIGVPFIPLTTNPKTPTVRLLNYAGDEGVAYVITNDQFSGHKFINAFENREQRIQEDMNDANGIYTKKQVLVMERYQEMTDEEPIKNPQQNFSHQRLAYVMNSSGSTGEPKRALIAHKGLVPFIQSLSDTMRISSGEHMAVLADIAFDAHMAELWCVFIKGAPVQLIPAEDRLKPYKYRHLYQEVTHGMFTPSILSRLAKSALNNVEVVLSTGEALENEELKKWVEDRLFINGYGPMEATIGVYLMIYENGVFKEAITTQGMRIFICHFDEEAWRSDPNKPLNPTQTDIGEIYLSGFGLAKGYTDPILTQRAFVTVTDSNGKKWRAFKTGDLAHWTDGRIKFVGRIDRQFKIHGRLIHAKEVEKIIYDSGLVKWAYVDGEIPEGSRHTRLFAHIVPAYPDVDLFDISHHLSVNFYPDITPAYWLKHEVEPSLNGNLKADRKALSKIETEKSYTTGISDLLDSIEYCALLDLWRQTLFLADEIAYQPRVDDEFFRLGGSSLSASDLIARFNHKFSAKLQLSDFYKNPTLGFLRYQLAREATATDDYFKCIHHCPDSDNAPIIFVHTLLGNAEEDYGKLFEFMRGGRRSIYTLSAPGLVHGRQPERIPAMADLYVPLIQEVIKSGQAPILVAWSAGGTILVEVANRLHQLGQPAITLLLDCDAPEFYQNVHRELFSEFILALYDKKLMRPNYPSLEYIKESLNLSKSHPIRQIGYLFDVLITHDQQHNEGSYVNKLKTIRSMLLAVSHAKFTHYPPNTHLWVAEETRAKREKLPNGQRLCWPENMNFASKIKSLPGTHESIIFSDPKGLADRILQFSDKQTALFNTRIIHQQLVSNFGDQLAEFDSSVLSKLKEEMPEALVHRRMLFNISKDNTAHSLASHILNGWTTGTLCPDQFQRAIYVKRSRLSQLPRCKPGHTIADLIYQLSWIDKSGYIQLPTPSALKHALMTLNQEHILWIITDDETGSTVHNDWEAILRDAVFRHESHVIVIGQNQQFNLGGEDIKMDVVKDINTDSLRRGRVVTVDSKAPQPSPAPEPRRPKLRFFNHAKVTADNVYNLPMQGPSGADMDAYDEIDLDVRENLTTGTSQEPVTHSGQTSGVHNFFKNAKIRVGGKATLPTPSAVISGGAAESSFMEGATLNTKTLEFTPK